MRVIVGTLVIGLVITPVIMMLITAPWPWYTKLTAVAWPAAIVACWYYLKETA